MSDLYHDRLRSSSDDAPSRRDFLKTGALSALALGTGGVAGTANGQPRTEISDVDAPGNAKNVIFLVSDGMSAGTPMPGGPVPEPSATQRAGELWTELWTY